MRIGVFDSGLGGLTVLKELRDAVPQAGFVYLGDTARAPYGSKSPHTIERYALECAAFLCAREIELLVVACNTASSLALDKIRAACDCPVVGTIEPAVQAVVQDGEFRSISAGSNTTGTVAVLGTRATVASSAYKLRLTQLGLCDVFQVSCPLFVPLVEEGIFEGPIVEQVVEHYLAPLKAQNVNTAILACTHYPLLRRAIQSFLGPKVRLVECSRAIAQEVARHHATTSTNGAGANLEVYTTDDVSRFNVLATTILGLPILQAQRVEMLGG